MSQYFMVKYTHKANQGFAFGFASLLHFYECPYESLFRLHAEWYPGISHTHAEQTKSELRWVLEDFRYCKDKYGINID